MQQFKCQMVARVSFFVKKNQRKDVLDPLICFSPTSSSTAKLQNFTVQQKFRLGIQKTWYTQLICGFFFFFWKIEVALKGEGEKQSQSHRNYRFKSPYLAPRSRRPRS